MNCIKEKTAMDFLNSGLQGLCARIENSKILFIAAMNGAAIGGGLELALACDFRIAVKGTKLGLQELKFGLIPSGGGTQRLVKLIGVVHAKELILLGDMLLSEEALKYGLLSSVVEREDLLETYENMVDKLCKMPAPALRLAKMAINVGANSTGDIGMMYEKICQAILVEQAEVKEKIDDFFKSRHI